MDVLYITPNIPYNKGEKEQQKSYNQIYYFESEGVKVDCLFLNNNFIYFSPSSNILEQSFNSSDIKITRINKDYKSVVYYFLKQFPYQILKSYCSELKDIIDKCLKSNHYDVVHIHYSLLFELHEIDWGNTKVIVDYFDPLSIKIKEKYEETINTITRILLKEELKRLIKYERMIMEKFNNGIVYSISDKNELSDRFNDVNFKMIPNVIIEKNTNKINDKSYPTKNLMYLYNIFINEQKRKMSTK